MYNTPVLLLVFNRPDLAERVLNKIKEVRPAKLFIAADGPRVEKTGEIELCTATRNIVLQNIDWPCEVKTLFRDKNFGCKVAVSDAISWFFEQVEEGIILEDDTLPDVSFFSFCSSMLEQYRTNTSVMHIGGDCFLPFPLPESYYFTNYTHIWGWATWRRAWNLYDIEMKDWKDQKQTNFLRKRLRHGRSEKYWKGIFDSVYFNEFDTWDYQWTYCCWINDGIAIAPAVNLITNIGFRSDATHTLSDQSALANIPACHMDIPTLKHPSRVEINKKADHYVRDNIYVGKPISLVNKIYNKLFKV